MFRIESLLSARLFLSPQLHHGRVYFISNLSGHLSLYVMDEGGSVPEPLIPPDIALQNPELIGGFSYQVFPDLKKILIMIDRDGDENYQPMLIPLAGGFPEPVFRGDLANTRSHLIFCNTDQHLAYLNVELRQSDVQSGYRVNLASGDVEKLAESRYGAYPFEAAPDGSQVLIGDSYTMGDTVLYLWEKNQPELKLMEGTPIDQRQPGQEVPLNGINSGVFTSDGCGLLLLTAIFTDLYGPAYLNLDHPGKLEEVVVKGIVHAGSGEMIDLRKTEDGKILVSYNIDGCSWLYESQFDSSTLTLTLTHALVGAKSPLINGVLEGFDYEKDSQTYVLSFSTATSPTQIYTIDSKKDYQITPQTHERVLGIAPELLSSGEDASFVSFDGTRISARLYLPAQSLGFDGPRPLVYYVHGGPQGQERPDFSWFSMPLIQYLTLNGFAVFVPNVRGSTGYGLNYTKQVDRDWGGQDRLDHVHALKVLVEDKRLDTTRAGVVGRSYGGYMTLTLAGRHPELWSAAVDMFGPYDLLTFADRIPETWKPYFDMALGNPVKDRDFLVVRSPRTYIDQIECPLLVIQGKNDPRVVERESHDLVEHLREQDKQVEYLMFENEGHDVLKFENRVRCYNAITDYFKTYLKP